jgi:serpin B
VKGFALALHRPLATLAGAGNHVWSPYSVAAALGLAGLGAAGRTRAELEALLGDLDALARTLAEAAAFPAREHEPQPPQLALANALWLSTDLVPEPSYLANLLSWPGGAAHAADFAGDRDGVRQAINAEVEKVTRGLVRELIGARDLTPATRAVLVNALWLKVGWQPGFGERSTRPATFHAPAGDRKVPTMHATRTLRLAEAGGWRSVTLPAAGGVAADILLPDGDLGSAEQVLTPDLLAALQAGGTARVDLALPRFRVAGEARLGSLLPPLGLAHAFSRDADFSALTRSGPLRIDNVLHKAVLRVDEQGLEGAAATAVAMLLAAAVRPAAPVPFHVDRPFLVLVRHAGTGAIYFLARVTEP